MEPPGKENYTFRLKEEMCKDEMCKKLRAGVDNFTHFVSRTICVISFGEASQGFAGGRQRGMYGATRRREKNYTLRLKNKMCKNERGMRSARSGVSYEGGLSELSNG